jgi:hypothetical protein
MQYNKIRLSLKYSIYQLQFKQLIKNKQYSQICKSIKIDKASEILIAWLRCIFMLIIIIIKQAQQ